MPMCCTSFIEKTGEGNRNHNLFKILNHLKRFNDAASKKDFYETSLKLNEQLDKPLSSHEIKNIIKNIYTHSYKSSCKSFEPYCQKCKLGTKKKPYNQYKNGYWKTIDRTNLIHKDLVGGLDFYPWDIEDTIKLTPEQKTAVYELRESKGINPIIDTVLKYRGIKIGGAALKEWKEYLEV